VNILTVNSVEAVSLSNNHVLDYGEKGLDNTRKVLDEAKVSYIEKDCSKVLTLENGLTVGLYATMYTDADEKKLAAEITAMKKQGVDVIIYAPHWGTEGSYRPTDEQKSLAYAAIDAGANIVCGTHPHVLQPIEEYHGGVIFYSLANFSFGGHQQLRDMDTAVVQQTITMQADGKVTLGERNIVPCSMSSVEKYNNYQPTPYAKDSEEYNRVLEKLAGTFQGRDLPIS
jgi:poly-gamma-glutamate synthesis protein (capsule biosynthesis protein)